MINIYAHPLLPLHLPFFCSLLARCSSKVSSRNFFFCFLPPLWSHLSLRLILPPPALPPPYWTLLLLSSQHLLSCGAEQMAEHVADLKYICPLGDVSSSQNGRASCFQRHWGSGGNDGGVSGGGHTDWEAEQRRHKPAAEAGLTQWRRAFRLLSEWKCGSRWSELLAEIYFLARSCSFSSRLRSQQETQSQHCCLFSFYTVYYIWSQNRRVKSDMWEQRRAAVSLRPRLAVTPPRTLSMVDLQLLFWLTSLTNTDQRIILVEDVSYLKNSFSLSFFQEKMSNVFICEK